MAADLTPEQYERAIGLAMKDGNKPAMEALLDEYSQVVTGPGNFMQRLGAGAQDVSLAVQQMAGRTTPEEIKEHNKYASRAVGGTIGGHLTRALPLAVTAMLPGGQRIAPAAAYGALGSMLNPTEDENMWSGKLTQGVMGALTGGAVQHGLNVAGPVLKKAVEKIKDFIPGSGARRVAERDFLATIPESERAAAEQALSGAVAARQAPMAAGTSGAPISTAAALGAASPKGQFSEGTARMLAAEREARDAGGMLGQPFRNMDETAAQQRWQHLEQNVGGDVPALKQDAKNIYDTFRNTTKIKGTFDPKDNVWHEINGAITDEGNPAVKEQLERIAQQYLAAKGKNDFKALHATRMEAFDDALSKLYQTDTKAAGRLREVIRGFENTFDTEMEAALGGKGKWKTFRDAYSKAKTAESQAAAGEDFLGKARTFIETPGGVPQLTGKRVQMADLAQQVDDYGRPVVSPAASDALQTVRREITQQLQPSQVGPKGSATAQNLNPSSPVLSRAIAAQRRVNQGILSPENLGAMALLEPMTAIGGMVGLRQLDKRALGIADQLMKIYTDPRQAAQILQKAQLPQQTKDSVMAILVQRMTAQGAAEQAGQSNDQQQGR